MPLDIDRLCIEPLNDLHRRAAFCCRDHGIQNFCRGQIAEHNRRNMIKAYVARDRDDLDIAGFYYLLNTSIEHTQLGPAGGSEEFKAVEKIPAVYLGMIGVHQPFERQGIGKQMMLHAFVQVHRLSELAGVWALTLDAIDEDAVAYYERFSFQRFGPGREMYLPLGTIRSVVDALNAEQD